MSEAVPSKEESEDEFVNPKILEALIQLGALVHHLVDRNVDLNIKLYIVENMAHDLEKRV